MFLTGFDAKKVNTLYVDKNLRYHGLLQAYSRTNRIINDTKSQGNIVVFRNLKKATDDALRLFADRDAKEKIFLKPYDDYVAAFNTATLHLQSIADTPSAVDHLIGEEAELDFVKAFRELLRLKNTLHSFVDFTFDDTGLTEQIFEDYKSKYLDIHDKVRSNHEKEKVSILEDVDFELELVRRDDINVDYILHLLTQLIGASEEEKQKIIGGIMTTLSGDANLRTKRELIEKFISGTIPTITDKDTVEDEFDSFWTREKSEALERISSEEGVVSERLEKLVDDYVFTGRKPRRAELASTLEKAPSILQRGSILKRVGDKFNSFIETFIEGI
jgi:type I restriction enzyme R subunit